MWCLLTAMAAPVDTSELPLEDFELERHTGPEDKTAGKRNWGRIGVHAGVNQWVLPAFDLSLMVEPHLGPILALHLSTQVDGVPTLDPKTSQHKNILLVSGALGLTIDPSRHKRLKPTVGVDFAQTLWTLTEDHIGVALGGRGRLGLDLRIAGPLCLSIEAHGGARYAPKLPNMINPRWTALQKSLGAKAGAVVRW